MAGGASPNHWLVVKANDAAGVTAFLNKCKDYKNMELTQEVKVVVISIQGTPAGFAPHLIATALLQTINKSNSFKSDVMSYLHQAAMEAGNATGLNDSTDGVSCEVQDNLNTQKRYLAGEINHLSLPNPNHNAKNGRQQMLTGGGKILSIIGKFVLDPWLLKACGGIAQDLVRVIDFATDALVLKLASSIVVKPLLLYDTPDVGNKMMSKHTDFSRRWFVLLHSVTNLLCFR